MRQSLDLAEVQRTGDLVIRKKEKESGEGYIIAAITAKLASLVSIPVASVTMESEGYMTATLIALAIAWLPIDAFKFKKDGISKRNEGFALAQLKSVTGVEPPITAAKELAAMRKTLGPNESLQFDPFEFMLASRPEGNTTWARLPRKGAISFYPKGSILTEIESKKWDKAFEEG